MAPPLRRGRALAAQRLGGLLFLVVILGLMALSVGIYTKAFTSTVDVVLEADRVGNQLGVGGDVKARGVLVGEIRDVSATESGARIVLALQPDKVDLLPADTSARLLPKTLFGEKFVALVLDDATAARPLADGDVIAQDRTETGRELAAALDTLLPLLQTLRPEQVSTTLNALSISLRGRGEQVGANLVLTRDYLAQLNPDLPLLAENFRGLADLADNLDATAPDLLEVLDDLSAVSRDLRDTARGLDTFLRSTADASGTLEGFVAETGQRFVDLARESVPNLSLYATYSPQFPCLSDSIVRQNAEGERVFGGLQPGLHITAEVIVDNGGFLPGDEPVYGEDAGPTCFGLEGEPVIPFPILIEVTDGYCDDQEERPGIQTECEGRGSGSVLRGALGVAATPISAASYDRAAVGLSVAPALGVLPADVPDVAVLLFGPVARS